MKFGFRMPSWRKSLAASTKAALTREIRRAIVPDYGKRSGSVFINPKKHVYNQLYNLTSVNPIDIVCGSTSDSQSCAIEKGTRVNRNESQVVVLEKIMKSDEKKLINDFLDGYQEYKYNMMLMKVNVKLSSALVEYYKRPASTNLFKELEQILNKRLSSAKRESTKLEYIAAIKVLNVLRECGNFEDALKQIK
ncbi:MAG: hypothetical protein IJZ49_02415 [Alistipes sp.]|nr:hypothetical protein [Alistipes sp.]